MGHPVPDPGPWSAVDLDVRALAAARLQPFEHREALMDACQRDATRRFEVRTADSALTLALEAPMAR